MFLLSGMEVLSANAWDAVRDGAADVGTALPAGNGTDALVAVIRDVLAPSAVRPLAVVLSVLLLMGLCAEGYVLCGPAVGSDQLMLPREVHLDDSRIKSPTLRAMPATSPPASDAPSRGLVQNDEAWAMSAEV